MVRCHLALIAWSRGDYNTLRGTPGGNSRLNPELAKVIAMGSHRLAGVWTQFKEQAKQHWGQLPDDNFEEIERRRDTLVLLIQEHYGVGRDEADRQIDGWLTGSVQARV